MNANSLNRWLSQIASHTSLKARQFIQYCSVQTSDLCLPGTSLSSRNNRNRAVRTVVTVFHSTVVFFLFFETYKQIRFIHDTNYFAVTAHICLMFCFWKKKKLNIGTDSGICYTQLNASNKCTPRINRSCWKFY